MVKCFSKKYGNKGRAFSVLAIQKLCQDACQRLMLTSLHHCLHNHRQYFTILG